MFKFTVLKIEKNKNKNKKTNNITFFLDEK